MFKSWIESSVNQLHNSAVAAFPHTTKRQHVVHEIEVDNLRLTPFIGVRTLLVRGHAVNEENGNEYNTIILFKNVNFNPQQNAHPFVASDNGQHYQVERLSLNNTNALLRCSCPDFFWRFTHYDHLDHSLFGRNRKPYEGQGLWQANPMELPGMCKHLMRMSEVLTNAGLVG